VMDRLPLPDGHVRIEHSVVTVIVGAATPDHDSTPLDATTAASRAGDPARRRSRPREVAWFA
jgi:hypothetical protein